jgi:Domain of unknown function (DUF6362)
MPERAERNSSGGPAGRGLSSSVARPRDVSDQIVSSHVLVRANPEMIVACLEWAGSVLLSMNIRSPKPADYRVFWPEFPSDPNEAYGYTSETLRAAIPNAVEIELMENVYTWLGLIDNTNARRAVCARSLVRPISQRYLYSWDIIAIKLHTDRRGAKRLHVEGIKDLSKKLTLVHVQQVVSEIIG